MAKGTSAWSSTTPSLLTPDDNGTLLVTCPDLPEVTTFGSDKADALHHARDAIEEAIAARIARRADILLPSAPPTQTALKAMLHRAMRAQNLRKAHLEQRLGLHGLQVDRLLNPRHASGLDQIVRWWASGWWRMWRRRDQ